MAEEPGGLHKFNTQNWPKGSLSRGKMHMKNTIFCFLKIHNFSVARYFTPHLTKESTEKEFMRASGKQQYGHF